ncbi:hypothetical protein NE237_031995 [Protea cynaroides]|uniref:Uncharacterized protein n=1 Tax=Protea cynaroides TaxID=273540 RepID=A0A9Q0L296_9MAGN|nr:hypothetical protein NE237_031995 [Protea cynaroides]
MPTSLIHGGFMGSMLSRLPVEALKMWNRDGAAKTGCSGHCRKRRSWRPSSSSTRSPPDPTLLLPSKMAIVAQTPDILGERQYGQDVRTQNVVACQAMANTVKSSLGPVGLNKLSGMQVSGWSWVLKPLCCINTCKPNLVYKSCPFKLYGMLFGYSLLHDYHGGRYTISLPKCLGLGSKFQIPDKRDAC